MRRENQQIQNLDLSSLEPHNSVRMKLLEEMPCQVENEELLLLSLHQADPLSTIYHSQIVFKNLEIFKVSRINDLTSDTYLFKIY